MRISGSVGPAARNKKKHKKVKVRDDKNGMVEVKNRDDCQRDVVRCLRDDRRRRREKRGDVDR